jgi:DNA-binding IclR family transcriptional regulator
LTDEAFESIKNEILEFLSRENLTFQELCLRINVNKEKIITVLRWLEDYGVVREDENGILLLNDF